MLRSYIANLLHRRRSSKVHAPVANRIELFQQLSQLVKSARMAEAQKLIADLSPEERRYPEIRLCVIKMEFHDRDPALFREALHDLLESHPEFAPAWVDLATSV